MRTTNHRHLITRDPAEQRRGGHDLVLGIVVALVFMFTIGWLMSGGVRD